MRHLRKIAKLGRNSGHRKALLVNMACSLIEHDQIETTVNRAKEVRRLVDRLITYGKKGGEHNRRLAIARIKDNTPADKAQTKKAVITKLFGDLAVRFAERNGGYTRIIRTGKRVGDAADACILQFVEAGAPASKKKAVAPAEAKAESCPVEAKPEAPAEEVKAEASAEDAKA